MKFLKNYCYFLLLISTFSFGQDIVPKEHKKSYKHHEVRLIYDLFSVGYYYNLYNNMDISDVTSLNSLYGLGYNYNFKSFNIKSKFLYGKYNYKIYKTSIGFSFQKRSEKWGFMLGADFGFFKHKRSEVEKIEGLSIEPFFGLKYFINKHFSLSSEARASYGKLNVRSTYGAYSPNGGPYGQGYIYQSHGSQHGVSFFSPILGSFSLNYNF